MFFGESVVSSELVQSMETQGGCVFSASRRAAPFRALQLPRAGDSSPAHDTFHRAQLYSYRCVAGRGNVSLPLVETDLYSPIFLRTSRIYVGRFFGKPDWRRLRICYRFSVAAPLHFNYELCVATFSIFGTTFRLTVVASRRAACATRTPVLGPSALLLGSRLAPAARNDAAGWQGASPATRATRTLHVRINAAGLSSGSCTRLDCAPSCGGAEHETGLARCSVCVERNGHASEILVIRISASVFLGIRRQ